MKEYQLTPGDSLIQKFFEIWRSMVDDEQREPVTFTHNGTRIIIIPDRDARAEPVEIDESKFSGYRAVLVPPTHNFKVTKKRKLKRCFVTEGKTP
jgi:hypothetical protein